MEHPKFKCPNCQEELDPPKPGEKIEGPPKCPKCGKEFPKPKCSKCGAEIEFHPHGGHHHHHHGDHGKGHGPHGEPHEGGPHGGPHGHGPHEFLCEKCRGEQ